jgi:hypothetical protein
MPGCDLSQVLSKERRLKMSDIPLVTRSVPEIHVAGVIAFVSGVISTIGVVLLIAMFALFATSQRDLGNRVGWLNDICVALQYLLTIPIALALYRILLVYNPPPYVFSGLARRRFV